MPSVVSYFKKKDLESNKEFKDLKENDFSNINKMLHESNNNDRLNDSDEPVLEKYGISRYESTNPGRK